MNELFELHYSLFIALYLVSVGVVYSLAIYFDQWYARKRRWVPMFDSAPNDRYAPQMLLIFSFLWPPLLFFVLGAGLLWGGFLSLRWVMGLPYNLVRRVVHLCLGKGST